MSGFDLNQPDAYQRRGMKLEAVGHGGIDLAARRGAEVRLVSLEHQLEAADRAVARIQAGTFGLSVESGGRIPSDRLEAAPLAERTVEEQRAFERGD